jgi:Protein tyrosine and serine/threonine kinase
LSTGGFPYPTVSNHELLNFLKSGQRLERPENCSETLYELMLQCWAGDSDSRPDFSDIYHKLDPNKNKIYIDFSELSPNYVFPPTSENLQIKNEIKKLSKA